MGILGLARRHAIERGLLGGSRTWLLLGGLAWAIRAMRWALKPAPTTVFNERLDVGETLVITHEPARPSRRQRRKIRRGERRSRPGSQTESL
jgi:hypothetical protein